ncbi:hypothetical protein ACA910_021379 [Epithemia clementina (nom. ined.)]
MSKTKATPKAERRRVMSDEDLCQWTSSLPDSVLLKAFDKPLGAELTKLSLVEKAALRALWWFNPNKWNDTDDVVDRPTKLKFIRFLLLDYSSTQHQIAQRLRETVVQIAQTLCGYNAVKGVCTTGYNLVHHHHAANETTNNAAT